MKVRDRVLLFAGLSAAALAALSTYARYAVRRFEDLEPGSAGAPGEFIDVDGVRMHYVEVGEGEPLLLVHGLGASTFSFRYVIPELAPRFRVVAVDLKGSGYSARPATSDYSLTAQADLLRRFMDRLQIERAAVVGHSMGGAVAMRLALRYPERVSRLVLVDSAGDHELERGRTLARVVRPFFAIGVVFTLQRRWFRRLSRRSAVHDPAQVTPEALEGYFRPTRIKGHARALASFTVDRARDEPLALERIAQPTLVMWGEHDRWLPPRRGDELARRIPNARLLIIRGAGHLPLEEQPDVCNLALLEFLAPQSAVEASPPSVARPS